MKRRIGWILAGTWIILSLCSTSLAQQPESNAQELSAVMRTIARYNSLGLSTRVRHEVIAMHPKYAETQRLIDHYAKINTNLNGKSQGTFPGFVTSFLIAPPFECASLHEFSQVRELESEGFDTSKQLNGTIYSLPN